MLLNTFVNAVALALFAAGAHARIPAGTYQINSLFSFAVTFKGEGSPVALKSLDQTGKLTSQQWVVTDNVDSTQSISLARNNALQCAGRGGKIVTVPANGNSNYGWTITEVGDPRVKASYILDAKKTEYCTVDSFAGS